MQFTTIGLDLAKQVFQIHGVDANGTVVVRKRLRRCEVIRVFASIEGCLVGMEACATAHYWAREPTTLGHSVRLVPPSRVKPYVTRGKTDATDAEAICEAVTRPTLRFVPIKAVEQQAAPMLHRSRTLIGQPRALHEQVAALECQIVAAHRNDKTGRRLASIPGVGPITASALAASVTNAHQFKSARQFAAWLGLTPRSNSSGGKDRLGGVSRQGDPYLRRLLVTGAASVIRHAQTRAPRGAGSPQALPARRPARLVSVALANKMARIVWVLLTRDEVYAAPGPRATARRRLRETGATSRESKLKVMADQSNREWEQAAWGSRATQRVDLYGPPVADFIRASGHVHRIKRAGHMSAPDRAKVTSESSCADGAVHT